MQDKLITSLSTVFSENHIKQHEFNYQSLNRFMNSVRLHMHTHSKDENAHSANQITYNNQTIADFYLYLTKRMNNLVIGHNGDGIAEVKDARVDNQGQAHDTLHERLRQDYFNYMNEKDEIIKAVESVNKNFNDIEYRFDPENQEPNFITHLSPRTNAVMQSFWVDYRTGYIFMTQARPGGSYMLTRLKPNGEYVDRLLVKNGGHGTHNAYRYVGNELWVYSAVLDNNKRNKFVRFKYKPGEIEYGNPAIEDVMAHVFNDRYTTAIYNSKNDLMIFRREYNPEESKQKKSLNFIEVRKMSDIDKNIDNIIYKFDIPMEYTSETQPMQGVTYDDGILYWYTGDSNPSVPNYLNAFDIKTSKLLWSRQINIGGIDGKYLGNFQEAEGLAIYYDEDTGKKALLIGVTTGPGNNRHHEIHSIAQRDVNDNLKSRAFPLLMAESGGRVKPLPLQGINKLSSVTKMGHYYIYTEDSLTITDFPLSKPWRIYGWLFDVYPANSNGIFKQVLTRASFGRNILSFVREVNMFTQETTVGWSYIKTYGEMWETVPKGINKLADINIPGLEVYLTAEDTKRFTDFPVKYKGTAGFKFQRIKFSENQYHEELRKNNFLGPPEILTRTTHGKQKSKWFVNKYEVV